MAEPLIGDEERRRLVADAHTDDGLDRVLDRLHGIVRDLKHETPGVAGGFERMLRSLDRGLAPDDPVAVEVDRYRRGVVDRAQLLAVPAVAERLRARMGQSS